MTAPNWDREHTVSRGQSPRTASFRPKAVRLTCGHEAFGLPTVTMPVAARPDIFTCPLGCGLVKAIKR